jgi:hypothetical protein
MDRERLRSGVLYVAWGEAILANPQLVLTVDLVAQAVRYADATSDVPLPSSLV